MTTVIFVVLILVWIVNTVCLVDAIRQPRSSWADADRDKGWWVAMLISGSLTLVLAFVMIPSYLIGVRPRLANALPVPSQFQKH